MRKEISLPLSPERKDEMIAGIKNYFLVLLPI
jgi:hypothetical protein